jgi:transcriptional regulator with XRE-family HTH domain
MQGPVSDRIRRAPGKIDGVSTVDEEGNQQLESQSPSTRAYLRKLRNEANLSVEIVAERAGVSSTWLERFEAGIDEGDVTYDLILRIVRATQPPRPDWWDEGHEHDLHLPSWATPGRDRHPAYWAKIDKVRAANREAYQRRA